MNQTTSALKAAAVRQIEACQQELLELSSRLHAHPELSYQEHQAAAWCSELLEAHGFCVERNLTGLSTAFSARLEGQPGGPTLALIAEYDALPGVGHGCGHNLIAAGSLGAAIGLAVVMDQLAGQVCVYGTPAEEAMSGTANGKIVLLERGAFAGVDAALMFHPYPETLLVNSDLAVEIMEISFKGKTAHAAADPWNGANALDGVLLTYTSINALRQHVKPEVRVHGIVTSGGEAPNIVPDYAAARFAVRARDRSYLQQVVQRVQDCARGAALATATEVSFRTIARIDNTRPNRVLEDLVRANWMSLTGEVAPVVDLPGSTDFGNLSQAVPAYWFMLKTHPAGVTWHSQEAARLAVSEQAHQAMLTGAKVLACSAIDFFSAPALLGKARAEFGQSNNIDTGMG